MMEFIRRAVNELRKLLCIYNREQHMTRREIEEVAAFIAQELGEVENGVLQYEGFGLHIMMDWDTVIRWNFLGAYASSAPVVFDRQRLDRLPWINTLWDVYLRAVATHYGFYDAVEWR